MANILENIKNIEIGEMVPIMATLPYSQQREAVFIIKDTKRRMDKLGDRPVFVTRSAMFNTDCAKGLRLMFMINSDEDLLYHCWINYYEDGGQGKEIVKSLSKQERIIIEYRDENEVKHFQIKNSLADTANEYLKESLECDEWKEEDFYILEHSVFYKYHTSMNLWNALYNDDKYDIK